MTIDSSELCQLWRRMAPSLKLLARTRGDWAEDCVQEAFIRLAKERPIPDDPPAWLVRVVRNMAIDMSRSEKRRKDRERRRVQETSEWFMPSEDMEPDIDGMQLKIALQALPAEDREIVVAHLWSGLTFRQIAEAFEIPSSTAHRKYGEAILSLRNQLTNLLNRTK